MEKSGWKTIPIRDAPFTLPCPADGQQSGMDENVRK
jgi:hypothetical protein